MIEVLEDRTLLADGINPSAGPAIIASPGVALSNVIVATYTIANSQGEPGTQWRARVDWGDGTAQDKKDSPTSLPDGSFEFLDSHTYATAGTYTVTVNIAVPGSHTPNDNVVTTTATVKVLSSIAVTPASPSVPKGETEQFHATGTFGDGTTQDLTNLVTWASATTSVASISNTAGSNGLATSLATGTSSITAKLNGVTGSTVLTVTPPALRSIAVTPAGPSVPKGETQQFTATGTLSDGTTEALTGQVTWASATTSVATITAGGLATAVGLGTSSITATSNSVTGSTVLTVTAPVLQSIAVTPADPSLPKGEAQQFTATGTFSDDSTQVLSGQVTWASATTSVATITAAGLATAAGLGTSTISAKLSGISGSTVLTVTPPVLQSIAVTPAGPSVPKGETQQFTATGTLSDGTTEALTGQVTWASATTSVATITAAGLAAAAGLGTSSISATLNGVSGSAVLTVTAPVLQSIAVTPAGPSVPKGETQQFTATGTLSDGTTEALTGQATWASATTSVATITAAGLATAAGLGTSSISATLNGVSGSAVLTVTAPVLQSIAVTPAGPSVPKGETQQFTATGTLSDGTTEALTGQVTWASATTSVATITTAGLATAVGVGTSSISATLDGITGSTVLTVSPAILVSIAVSPDKPSIIKGTTQPFTATGTLSDETTEDLTGQVTWASATTSVATITVGGLADGVATGTSTISATLDGINGSTLLTVIPAPLSSIAITPSLPSIPDGETEPFTATGTFADGSTQDLTGSVTWASATGTVATISNAAGSQGVATAVGQGTSNISATLDGISDSTVLTVTAPVLQSIAVTPADPNLPKGETQQFTATGTLSDGTTEDLTGQVTWASATTSAATITAAGLADALATGASSISATLDGITGSTVLTVIAPVLQSIAVTPADPSVPKGETQPFTATGTLSDNSTEDITGQVTWASATTSVATITAAGLATAAGPGTSNISATMGGISGSTALTVTAPVLQSIVVTPADPSVPKGETEPFKATGTLSDGTSEDLTGQVTWASATTSVATITGGGLAAAITEGTSSISATMGGISGSTVLTVSPAVLLSIAVTPADPSIASGTTEPFTATGTFSDHSTEDVTAQVTWASRATSIATITALGLASGVAPGTLTTTITATLQGVSGTTVLTVSPAPLVSIAVTPADPSIPADATEPFTAIATFADHSTEDVTTLVHWSSSSTAAAVIDSSGLATGVAAGTATISATMDGISGSTSLTVTAGPAPAPTPSPSPTPTPPPVTVNHVSLMQNKKHQLSQITFQFGGALNAAEASSVATYRLAMPGKHGSFTAKSAKVIRLKSAAYNAALDQVTLTPKKPFAIKKPVQLLIHASPPGGLQDGTGRFINGGEDVVFLLGRQGATVSTVAVRTSASDRLVLKAPAVDVVLHQLGDG